jgi:hypothetical protein
LGADHDGGDVFSSLALRAGGSSIAIIRFGGGERLLPMQKFPRRIRAGQQLAFGVGQALVRSL